MKLVKSSNRLKEVKQKEILGLFEPNEDLAVGLALGIAYMKIAAALNLHQRLDEDPSFLMDGVHAAAVQLIQLADHMGFDCMPMPNYYGERDGHCDPGKEGMSRYVFTLKLIKRDFTLVQNLSD